MVDAAQWERSPSTSHERPARSRASAGWGVAVAATKSTLADIVTEADREVEQLIRDRLARSGPTTAFSGRSPTRSPARAV
jgi:myo-inositol-1(or 4)-monophosphatase